jgi:hypothetical protein
LTVGSAAGDLVAIAGMDTTDWVQGCIRLQNSTNQAAGAINNNLGRTIGQVGFAIQDFSSVLGMGGKNALGRALMSTANNVQMLGQAFGPWGMAISSVAGALGAILIPKLFESGEATKTMADNIKDSLKDFEEMQRSATSLNKSLMSIGNVDSSKGMKSRLDDVGTEIKISSRMRSELEARLTEQYDAAVNAGMLENTPGRDITSRIISSPTVKGAFGSSVGGSVETKDALLDMVKSVEKAREAERHLMITRDAGVVRMKELEKAEADKAIGKAGEADFKRRNEEYARSIEEAGKIIEASRSPLDIAKDKLAEIQSLSLEGHLTPAQARIASDKVVGDFAKSSAGGSRPANTAAIGGTSEGFSALQASLRQGNERSNDQLTVLRQMAELMKQQLAAINKNSGPAPTVGIGGSL